MSSTAGDNAIYERIRAFQYDGDFKPTALETFRTCTRELLERSPASARDPEFLKACARLLEIGDFLDVAVEELQPLCSFGPAALAALPKDTPAKWSPDLDARLRYCLAFVQVRFYRGEDFPQAHRHLTRIAALLKGGTSPASRGLRGWCEYMLGQLSRRTGEFHLSRHHFGEGLRLWGEWSELKRKAVADLPAEVERVVNTSQTLITLSLVGLASGEIRTGSLARSLTYCHAGKQGLPRRNELLAAVLKLTYGTALRSYAGDDPAKAPVLRKAITLLREAKATAEEYGHRRHAVRAARELAVAFIYAGDAKEAEKHCKGIEQLAGTSQRWKCEAQLCRSRISRELEGNPGAAAELATKALNTAEQEGLKLTEIDARIQRAFANLEGGTREELRQAQRDVEAVLRRSASPRHIGIANLLLARCLIMLGHPDEARRPLELGEALTGTFEFPTIRRVAEKVRGEYVASLTGHVVVIEPDKRGLNYELYERELRNALVDLALRRHKNVRKKAAHELGVTRATLSSWMERPAGKKETKRHSRTSRRARSAEETS